MYVPGVKTINPPDSLPGLSYVPLTANPVAMGASPVPGSTVALSLNGWNRYPVMYLTMLGHGRTGKIRSGTPCDMFASAYVPRKTATPKEK